MQIQFFGGHGREYRADATVLRGGVAMSRIRELMKVNMIVTENIRDGEMTLVVFNGDICDFKEFIKLFNARYIAADFPEWNLMPCATYNRNGSFMMHMGYWGETLPTIRSLQAQVVEALGDSIYLNV